jgi:integrase
MRKPTRRNLTERLVASLKPGERDQFVWDAKLPGFGVRARPGKAPYFLVQYRTTARQQRRRKLGVVTALKVEEARRRAKAWLEAVGKDRDPAGERDAVIKGKTVAELADRYHREYARLHKKPSSIAEDERLITARIKPKLGSKKVAAVSDSDIEELHGAMEATPYEANRTLALLSKMFRLAEKWKLRPAKTNPCQEVRRYKERKRERFLSTDELARLGRALAEAERARTEHIGTISAIRLLVFTGMRLGEVRGLQWRNVDAERVCLRLEDSKTGPKTVHLNAPALEVLSGITQTADSPWVFVSDAEDEPLSVWRIESTWRRIRKQAGIADCRLHDLRHSFASVGAAGGLSLPVLGALLGHTQPVTTQRYSHLSADPLKQATDMIGQRIAAAMTGRAGKVVSLGKAKRDRRG